MLKIEATTLAVLMNENDSITCGLDVSGKNEFMSKPVNEYTNLTLRFEDDIAKLAGFPRNWTLAEDYDVEEGVEIPQVSFVHIGNEEEKEILVQLKSSLKKQFEDEMFKDQLTDIQKSIALEKIDKAISKLS